MTEFVLPGAEHRTAVIGRTGSGKTVFGSWLLSKQHLDKRPWVAIDFKNEELWDLVGDPPMRDLKLGKMPGKNGLYRLQVRPGQEDELEEWLWKTWEHGDIGLFCDEVSLMPRQDAFKAILRQGRSKRIPVIACTQRPVGVDREVFSEAQFISIFSLNDARDLKTVQEFIPQLNPKPLPSHHSYWFDVKKNRLDILKPCPDASTIAQRLKDRTPYSWSIWG